MAGQQSNQWSRDTKWRQGHVLSTAALIALGLKNSVDELVTPAVVISHDCDLANDDLDIEPNVEIILGSLVPAPNGNFTWGKAPRTLHLPMTFNGEVVTVELVATNKIAAPKSTLGQFDPSPEFALDGKGLNVLRSWLSARYKRSAFSDAFVNRMSETKLDQKLAKALQPHGGLISFVNFDIDGGKNVERAEGDPYTLSIVLVYPPGDDPETSAETAQTVVQAVEKVCDECLSDATRISLKRCIAISEDDMTISQARVLMQWRLEHMTNKANDHLGPVAV